MDLAPHLDRLHEQLAVAAEAGGEEAQTLARRLLTPLDAALRLMLLEVLAIAAAEITRELAPGSVEVRLRGADPEFVVLAPPEGNGDGEASLGEPLPAADGGTEGGVSRINMRLPEQLKSRVEQAAEREGLSINAWLVRAAAAGVQRGETGARREDRSPRGGRGYVGWGR